MLKARSALRRFPKNVVSIALASVLTACGGGSDTASTDDFVDVSLAGSVGDGPVVGAQIFIFDKGSNLAASHTSDAFANYELSFRFRGNPYPLTIEAIRGTDLVTGTRPDFTLKSYSFSKQQPHANLNPYTTMIVEVARAMPGGITEQNIQSATTAVLREMNFGLDMGTVPDPVTTRIDEGNIANIVRSSEAFGEMIRRTRTAMAYAGFVRSHNDVVAALAADLTDGRFDGRGSSAVDARLSAAAAVASTQVVVETMMNRLKVNGTPAVGAMDNAIRTTLPSTPANAMTASVRIPQSLISQAKRLMDAYLAVDNAAQYSNLRNVLVNVAPGTSTASMTAVLSDAHSQIFDAPLINIAQASDSTISNFSAAMAGEGGSNNPPQNTAPTLSGSAASAVIAGNSYSFTPVANDADGDALTFSIANRPSWASFNSSTGRLSGTPTSSHIGNYSNIVISVSDGTHTTALTPFSVSVNAANSAPVISGTPQTSIVATNAYSFTPTASDANGDTLTFSITNRPSWASFNSSTGRLSGTPTNSHVGTTSNIVISVSDGQASRSLGAFNLTVTQFVPPNSAPVISGSAPTSVLEDSAYSFTPSASDANGDSLTFSVTNRPSWMSFNSSTGRLSGTPTNNHVGSYGNIVVSVSDGQASASLPPFSVTVVNVNDAPSITGTSVSSVNAGSSYSFTPSASDVDGDTLTFSISNRPAWASFNSSTGRLSGTPSESNVGTYSNIVITVSDGTVSRSLAAFSLTVVSTAPANRDVTLNWVAPTTRANGDPISLSEIASYRIHYGTSQGNYTNTVNVANAATSYTIQNMTPATYYFTVTAIDMEGQESGYSSTVSTTVQ